LKINWKIKLGIILLLASVAMYCFAYFALNEHEKVIFYLVIDFAFMPLDVLVVVLVVEGIINKKEKENILEKLDMIMSVFFSEFGTEFLSKFINISNKNENINKLLKNLNIWSDKEFSNFLKDLKKTGLEINLDLGIDQRKEFLTDLKQLLVENRGFLIRLLENPNLLEKDTFSNLLLAIFHLDEELERRDFNRDLIESDYEHLTNDINRVYSSLIYEWVNYLYYLKLHYPYMFSIAVRTNPFDDNASIYVNES
jgi:hypothetical protein